MGFSAGLIFYLTGFHVSYFTFLLRIHAKPQYGDHQSSKRYFLSERSPFYNQCNRIIGLWKRSPGSTATCWRSKSPNKFRCHGGGKTSAEQEELSQFSNEYFNPNGIAVYPQGIDVSFFLDFTTNLRDI
jgi:hypothetical protein